jgi:hypothetical protein
LEGAPPAPFPSTGLPDVAVLLEAHPEITVGAAFAGGFVVALILKRLGR